MNLKVGNFLSWNDLLMFSGRYEVNTLQEAIDLMNMKEEAEEIAKSDPTIIEDLESIQKQYGELRLHLDDISEEAKDLNDQTREEFPKLKKIIKQNFSEEEGEKINGFLDSLKSFLLKI